MTLSQNHVKYIMMYYFYGKKGHHNKLNIWQKPKSPVLEKFLIVFSKMSILMENPASSVFDP